MEAAAAVRSELTCRICQKTFTDPVSLSCGHNFCRLCIDYVLDKYAALGEYSCPQCFNKKLRKRPLLFNSTQILDARGAYQALLGGGHTEPVVQVYCLYCVGSQVPAAKTCVQCETSLCGQHLEAHSENVDHILIPPTLTTALAYRKCSKHNKFLQYYCSQDAVCVCESCCLVGNHRGHDIKSVNDACDNEKIKLHNLLSNLKRREAKTDGRIQSLEKMTGDARQKVDALRVTVSDVFKELNKQSSILQKAVKDSLYNMLQPVSRPELARCLHKQKAALANKIACVEAVCNVADPVALLQKAESDKHLLQDVPAEEPQQREDLRPPIGAPNEEFITKVLLNNLSRIVGDLIKLYSGLTENVSADGDADVTMVNDI